MKNLLFLSSLAASLLLSACNLGPGPGTGDDDDDDTPPVDPVDVAIADLTANPDDYTGSLVTVEGVVTTPFAIDTDRNEGMFWIQDGEGPGSGMLIFTYPDVVEELEMLLYAGDSVSITGEFDVPFGAAEIVLDDAADLTVTGTGSLPEPWTIDAGDLEAGFADPLLHGVIVALEDVQAESSPGWDNFFRWAASAVLIDHLSSADDIDDLWYYADVQEGDTVHRVAGVVHLDFGDAVIVPRWADDLDFSAAGCEDAADGVVQEVNCGEVDEDDDISLEGLVVNSPEPFFGNSFWVQDPSGALFGGIQVYSIDDLDSPPAIGTVLNLSGEYEEFNGSSEIVVFDAEDIEEVETGSEPEAIELASACDISEAYEGMLVHVASVEVSQTSEGAEWGFYQLEGCPEFLVDSLFWSSLEDFAEDTGGPGTITNLYGIVTDEFSSFMISPRDSFDWDSWAGNR